MNDKPSVGLSTLSLGGVTVVAYILAIVAYLEGARDEATITTAAVGTVALVTMAAGRFSQAVAAYRATRSSWGVRVDTPNAAVAADPIDRDEFAGEPAPPADAELRDLHENDIT